MQTSETIAELSAALAKAQGDFDTIHRNREVTVRPKDQTKAPYKFTYATLDEVLRATRKALADNGLAITHPCYSRETVLACGTRLTHSSGQWIENVLEVNRPSGMQELGSATTYMRRYTLTSILGVVADEDDDGNTADGNDAEFTERQPSPECPHCKSNKAVIKGSEEYGGGWVCWKKKDGCGHKWQDSEPEPPKKQRSKKPTEPDNGEAIKHTTSKYSEALAKLENFHGDDAAFSVMKAKFFDWLTKAEGDQVVTTEQANQLTEAMNKLEDKRAEAALMY